MKPDAATIRFLHGTELHEQQRFRRFRLLGAIAAMAWALLVPASLVAQLPKPSEYQVKAAYIYNFGKFVKWPPTSVANQSSSFIICALGEDSMSSILQSTLSGKSIAGRPVTVKQISKPQDAIGCQILFLNLDEKSHLQGILSALGRASVLTVSDIPDFSKRGGMIQFVLEDDRVRFEINRASAESAGLTLTSDLLKVATVVRGTGQTGDQ